MIYIIYPKVDLWEFVLLEAIENIQKRPLNSFTSTIQQGIRKLNTTLVSSPFLLLGKTLRQELSQLSVNDVLIVADYMDISLLLAIDRTVSSNVKKYLWLWNPLKGDVRDRYLQIHDIIREKYIVATFDPNDAEEFGLELHSQFYRMDLKNMSSQPPVCDFYFMGFDKGRETMINDLRIILKDYQCRFNIVHRMSEFISYDKYLHGAMEARCLVDIVQEGQSGLTLRPLEAVALGKKLLTNNRTIKASDIYDPNNVFLIGERSWDDFDEFLYSPCNWANILFKEYDVLSWLNSFR